MYSTNTDSAKAQSCASYDNVMVFQVFLRQQLLTNSNRRVANLEQKLDSIVTLLADSQRKESSTENTSPSNRSQPSGSLERDNSSNSGPSPIVTAATSAPVEAVAPAPEPPPPFERYCVTSTTEATPFRDSLRTSRDVRPNPSPFPTPREFEMGEDEQDAVLRIYSNYCAPYFPFAIIPAHENYIRLQDSSPFFLDVITFLTSGNVFNRQVAYGEKILTDIVNRLLLRPEKTSEVLQGLLLFTVW